MKFLSIVIQLHLIFAFALLSMKFGLDIIQACSILIVLEAMHLVRIGIK